MTATQKSRRYSFSAVFVLLNTLFRFTDFHLSPDSGWQMETRHLYAVAFRPSVQYSTQTQWKRLISNEPLEVQRPGLLGKSFTEWRFCPGVPPAARDISWRASKRDHPTIERRPRSTRVRSSGISTAPAVKLASRTWRQSSN